MRSSIQYFHLFPKALTYLDHLSIDPLQIKESSTSYPEENFKERHLHCIWFDPLLRPKKLKTSEGLNIEVEFPGEWNLESGPDFKNAIIRVGDNPTALKADVEIHIHPGDWLHHKHQHDPNFQNVLFHVTYYPGTLPAGSLPYSAMEISLYEALHENPYFAFEQIEIAAYPYDIEGPLHPLRQTMSEWNALEKEAFLEAAGEERLRRKAVSMGRLVDRVGIAQALYEEIMVALGYKQNKSPFRSLAKRMPLSKLKELSKSDPENAYALLLGISNLMPSDVDLVKDKETAHLIRDSWDYWWKIKDKLKNTCMSRHQWSLAHIRPANHPMRRMMAAAVLFAQDEELINKIRPSATIEPKQWIKDTLETLKLDTENYWTKRLALGNENEKVTMALIGEKRGIAILTNVLVPFLAASDEHALFSEGLAEVLPSESMNSIIKQTAHALFGPDHSPKLYNSGLKRQGLIQIFQDFGLSG